MQVQKFHEVQKYYSVTNHMYNPQALLISRKVWDTFTEDEKKLVLEAAAEARDYQRKVSRQKNAEALETLRKTLQVNEVAPAEIARMREKAKPVFDKYARQIGEPLVQEMVAEVQKVRAKR